MYRYNWPRRVMFGTIGFAGGMMLWGMWVIIILAGRFDPNDWFPYGLLMGLDIGGVIAAGVVEERRGWPGLSHGMALGIGVSIAVIFHFLHDYYFWWRG